MKPLTLSDLHTRQAWPLNQKIDHTVGAIEAFVNYCKEHGRAPYASFSGGLNSTVLLDLARRYVDPNMPGVFCSTGNEYPEIVRFVRHTKNVTIIRPTMTPREVMARYGFPLVSKEQAHAMRDIQTSKSEKLRNYRLYGDGIRTCGILARRWRYLITEPYMTSEKCYELLKKRPFAKYNRSTQSLPMVGTMAGESKRREMTYINRGGCNIFSDDPTKTHSAPLSIWTNTDCWDYIHRFDVPYCSIYDVPGIDRTGCVFCGFGAHLGGGSLSRTLFPASETLPNGYELHQQRLHATLRPPADGCAATRRTTGTFLNMAIRILYVDLFCGAGGTSTGVERARLGGRKCAKVIACVNHDANAIASHAANHPNAQHFTEDIRTLNLAPLKGHVEKERRRYPKAKVVLWASLECTNHSRAKGGTSRDADSRTLAEHLFRYIEELQPDYIHIENVVEFMEWGPLVVKIARDPETGSEYCPLEIKRDKRHRATSITPVWIPDPDKKGIHYRRWVQQVREYGYKFEHRVLNAADFGAYTSRVRYFGQFARPKLPMAWPQQTHAKNPTADLFSESLKPWRAVREVLNFEDRGESIFARRKPLVDATLDRIYAGLVKFVAGGEDAFLVKWNSRNQNTGKYIAPDLNAPCPTVATQNRLGVARVDFLSKQFGGQPQSKNIPVTGPAGTITTVDHHAFVSAYYGNGYNSNVNRPAPTLTTKDRFQLVQPFIANYYSGGGQLPSVDEPSETLTTTPKQRLVNAHYLMNPQYRSAGGSVDAPCFTLITRMDKRPPYLVSVEQGVPAWHICPDDSPAMVRVKEFCILYRIVDVTMRMLRIPEMKRIQGFGDDYVLVGTSEEQKKYLGNAVVTQVATAWSEAVAAALERTETSRTAA